MAEKKVSELEDSNRNYPNFYSIYFRKKKITGRSSKMQKGLENKSIINRVDKKHYKKTAIIA